MDGEKKVAAYLELYKTQLDRFNKRRDIEWKVNMALWTGAALLIYHLHGKMHAGLFMGIIFAAVWLLYTFLWTGGCWFKNAQDTYWAMRYLVEVESLLEIENKSTSPKKPSRFGFLVDWSRLTQILVSGLLLLSTWFWLREIPVE